MEVVLRLCVLECRRGVCESFAGGGVWMVVDGGYEVWFCMEEEMEADEL